MVDTVKFWQYCAAGNVIEPAPFTKQCLPPFGVALFQLLDVRDPVRTEISKISSKLAPAHQDPRLVEIHQSKGPHDTLRLNATGVHVGHVELMLFPDCGTQKVR